MDLHTGSENCYYYTESVQTPALPAQWSGAGYTASGRAYYSSTEGYYLYFDPNCNGATNKWHIVYGAPSTTATSNLHSSCGQFQISYASHSMFYYTSYMLRSVSATCNGVASTTYYVRAQGSAPALDAAYMESSSTHSSVGTCQTNEAGALNRFYIYQGRTASGSPWYATPDIPSVTKFYLFYDSECTSGIYARWIMAPTAPSTTAASGLAGGECGDDYAYLHLGYEAYSPGLARRDVPMTSIRWLVKSCFHSFWSITNRIQSGDGVGTDYYDALHFASTTGCSNLNEAAGNGASPRYFIKDGYLANGAKVYRCQNCGSGTYRAHSYLTWDPSCSGASNRYSQWIMWSLADYNNWPSYYDGLAGSSIPTESLYAVNGGCNRHSVMIPYSYRRGEAVIGNWGGWGIYQPGCSHASAVLNWASGTGNRISAGRRLAQLHNVSASVGRKHSARNGSVLR